MQSSYQRTLLTLSRNVPTGPASATTASQSLLRRWASTSAADEDDVRAARQWLARLDASTIPTRIAEVTFARSSGPGGQNVNKVNSKATLRVPLESLLPLLPKLFHQRIRAHRTYAPNSDSLVIQSDDSRKQSDNVQSCYRKLHEMIREVGAELVPGETSEEKKKHIKNLIKAGNEARLRTKKAQSSKKSARRSSRGGGDD